MRKLIMAIGVFGMIILSGCTSLYDRSSYGNNYFGKDYRSIYENQKREMQARSFEDRQNIREMYEERRKEMLKDFYNRMGR